MTKRAIVGADIFDGTRLLGGKALLVEDGTLHSIIDAGKIPADFAPEQLNGGTVLPGFVDLQANGGGGILFNDQTSVDGLRVIAKAHAETGTRAFLPTLITDAPEKTAQAIGAVEAAIAEGVPGIVGIHLEGPHLSVARKGAHDASLIRPMEDTDEAVLCDAAKRLPNVLVTVAPENASAEQIARLSAAGLIVSLGHTDCSFADARAAVEAGATCVTHLFNAMSPLGSREPGLVGAALQSGRLSAGLIADGVHVHPAAMRTAFEAKARPGQIFLVTDAMATLGSDITEFHLNQRRILRKDGRLTLEDGTLAGADLEMARALLILIEDVGVTPATAFAMATSIPAGLLRTAGSWGHFLPGKPANAIHLSRYYRVRPV